MNVFLCVGSRTFPFDHLMMNIITIITKTSTTTKTKTNNVIMNMIYFLFFFNEMALAHGWWIGR
jgi:hypothetical protein